MQIEWDDNEEFYRAWEEGRTGYPWIDAIMTQLREQGWMHHLARHAVVGLTPPDVHSLFLPCPTENLAQARQKKCCIPLWVL